MSQETEIVVLTHKIESLHSDVGDALPMHNHTELNAHITVVARGSVKAHGNGWEKVLKSGAVIDFPPNQEHQFIALEDNTRIVNITKK
jgi:quercetin dioxygenase-like cupin family protein